jgi:hypothetical protein
MPRLLEYLGSHVSRGATRRRQDVESILVHYPAQTKVCYQKVGVLFRGPEEKVLGLEIAVDDPVVVKIGDGREDLADELGGVRLVVAALTAYAVEELAAEGKVGDKIYCRRA